MSIRHSDDRYGSLPSTPMYGIDPRPHDMALAMDHARMAVEAPDYFSGSPRYGGSLRPRSPFPSSYDHENYGGYGHELGLHELNRRYECNVSVVECEPRLISVTTIHRTNLAAALANGNIGPRAQYSQVHPFICHDGRYPQDFEIPRTVESMRILDSELQVSCFHTVKHIDHGYC